MNIYIYNNISNDPRKKQERNSTDEKNEEMIEWNQFGGRYDTYLRFNIEYTSPALVKDVLDCGFACTVVVAREFCGLDKGVLGTEFEEGFFVGEVVGFAVLFAFAGGAGCVCTSV